MLKAQGLAEEEQQGYAGRWISFDDTSSLPDLWIKKAQISLQWQQEKIISDWQDITHQHYVLGRPTLFSVNSSSSSLWQSLIISGDLWLDQSGIKANQNWVLSGLKLSSLALVSQKKLTSQLDSGLLSSSGKAALNGKIISGTSNIDFQKLIIKAKGSNKIANIVAETLNQLKKLTVNTEISGTVDNINLSLSSNLNKQIGAALLSNVSTEKKAKLDELNQKLNNITEDVMETNNNQLAQWLDWEKIANGDLDSINDLLETRITGLVDSNKDKLKNKLFDKLFN